MRRIPEITLWPRWMRRPSVWALVSAIIATSPAAARSGQSLLDRPARVDVANVTLEEALRALHRFSGVAIAFSPDRLPRELLVTCHCTELTLRQALDRLLEGTGLGYQEGRRQILVGRTVAGAQDASAASGRDESTGVLDGLVVVLPDGRAAAQARITLTSVDTVGRPVSPSPAVERLLTDDEGRFRVALPPGRYAVGVEAMGARETGRTQIGIPAGRTTRVTIRLEVSPIPLEELVVTASTFGILGTAGPSGQVMSREDLESQPHPGNDIVRAVQRLPGISNTDYSAKPVVRGARADEVLTILDGLELYEPYHLRYWDGSLSVVDVEMVSEVSVNTGGFTTEYGNKSAGVLSMRSADPPLERARTTIGLDFMSSIAKSEGSFQGGKGSWLASARRGFLAFVFDLMNMYADEDLRPSYYDLFSRLQYEVAPGHRISARVLHASDDNRGIEMDSTVYQVGSKNSYAWLNWEADFGHSLLARTVVSFGRITREREGADYWDPGDPPVLRVDDENTAWDLGLRQDWQLRKSSRALLKWGFDFKQGTSDYDYFRANFSWIPNFTEPQGPDFWPRHDTVTVTASVSGYDAGAYLAGRARLGDKLTLEGGLRYDRQSHTGEHQVSPRINGALQVGPRSFIRGAWGHYYQSQSRRDLWSADLDTNFYPAQKAEHRVLGLEHTFRNGTSLRIEGYQRLLSNPLPEYRRLARNLGVLWEEELPDRVFVHPDRGRAKGIELFAKGAPRNRFAWSATYALSKTEERVAGAWVPRPYDQRHALNLQIAFHPTHDWTIAAGWVYHSSWPFTEIQYRYAETIWGEPVAIAYVDTLNQRRLAAYNRLDFRASRRLRVGRNDLLFYVDVFNVLNRENTLDHEQDLVWTGTQWTSVHSPYPQLPILPSLGLKWTF